MEIVLRETIDKLGRAGETVKVKSGYARNYLLPRKLAYPATPGNLKIVEQERSKRLRIEAKQKEAAEKLKEMLNGVETSFKRLVGEHDALYGSVTSADIAEALEAQGYSVDKRKIDLDEHIKKLGVFTVPIRLFPEVIAEIRVRVEREDAEGVAAPAEPAPEAAPE